MRIRNNLILLLLIIITDLTAQTLKATFDDALNLYQSKNYSSAYDLFKSISRDKSVNENEKSSSLLYAAECLSKLNQLDGAAS